MGHREFPFGYSGDSRDPEFPMEIPVNFRISVKFRREITGIWSNRQFKKNHKI